MMKQLVHILLLLSLCYLPACREKAPKPGTERFYCRVNGKPFRPHSGGDFFNHPVYAEWDTRGRFNLVAHDFSGKYGGGDIIMSAELENIRIETATYSILPRDRGREHYASYYGEYLKLDGDSEKDKFEAYGGTLTISKYDAESKLVSGTFEFKAKSIYTDETLEVTKGQFNDVHVYQVY